MVYFTQNNTALKKYFNKRLVNFRLVKLNSLFSNGLTFACFVKWGWNNYTFIAILNVLHHGLMYLNGLVMNNYSLHAIIY